MSENEKRIIEKDSFSDKVKFNPEKNEYMVKRTISTYKYDVLTQHKLGRNPIKVKTEWLPLDVLDPKPQKKIEINCLLKRTGIDTNTILPLKAYFTMKITATVYDIERYKHIFLTTYNGEIVLNDIALKYSFPIGLSRGHEAVELKFSKPERITEEEAKKLNLSGMPLYEQQGKQYLKILGEFGKA
jgi:hypothetical protein